MPPIRASKTRHQFYLPDALSAKLDALARQPDASKTSILSDARTAWIERSGAQELDERFGPRLDRMTRASERNEEKLNVPSEAFGLFVLHQLALTAHQPAFNRETSQLGRERYDRFASQVGARARHADGRHRQDEPEMTAATKRPFAPTANIILHDARTPLVSWFYAMHLFSTTRHGVSTPDFSPRTGSIILKMLKTMRPAD